MDQTLWFCSPIFVSILEIEMVTYQEVHAVEVAQLIPLFSVLLFSFHAMNTAAEQHSVVCWPCAV